MTCIRRASFFLILLLAAPSFADFPGEKPYPGITYHFATRTNPPNRLHWVEIDLSDPKNYGGEEVKFWEAVEAIV